LTEQLSKLNDLAHQFRIVQKRLLLSSILIDITVNFLLSRLLTRFKDRNPVPISGMDILMKETYYNIITISDDIEINQIKLRNQMEDIECVSRLIAKLVGMKYKLDNREVTYLVSLLCPELRDGINQGWEETVDAAMTYCLKTSLAKTPKATANLSSNLEIPNSVDNLKKHITMVIDRIGKGFKLIHSDNNDRK
jgi:Bardet-Biedl syndrome 9 protein